MQISSGHRSKKDSFFIKVVEETLELNRRYIENHDHQDALFGYTEMSNVSLMATASWNLHWPAIVEYQFSKHTKSGFLEGDYKKKRTGKVDLYMSQGADGYVCEAKLYASNKGNLNTKALRNSLIEAFYDAHCSRLYEDGSLENAYSIVFVAHKCMQSDNLPELVGKIQSETLRLFEHKVTMSNTKPSIQNEALKIDGFGHLFLNKPIEGFGFYGERSLFGLTILFKRID